MGNILKAVPVRFHFVGPAKNTQRLGILPIAEPGSLPKGQCISKLVWRVLSSLAGV